MKFKGEMLNGLNIEMDLIRESVSSSTICTFVKQEPLALMMKPETIEINVSGHWLKIEDLEAIVEKVMGGKGES